MMKDALNKTLLTLAGIVLVLPFAAFALLAGTRALHAAESATFSHWLLVGLALCGALASALNAEQKQSAVSVRVNVKTSEH